MRSLAPFGRLAAAAVIMSCAASCAPMTLAWTDLSGSGAPAAPPIFIDSPDARTAAGRAAQWRARAPDIADALQDAVYGRLPDAARTRVLDVRLIDEAAYGGHGRLVEFRLEALALFDGVAASTSEGTDGPGFAMQLITPTDGAGPFPVILMETFCPFWSVLARPDLAPEGAGDEMNGVMASVATYVFGRYICTPPIEDILRRGYAIAVIDPGQVIPDASEPGRAALARLSAGHAADENRWGAIAAWGWLFSRGLDALAADPMADVGKVVVWGHSRYAKAALVAAAFDDRFAGVVAHQSGTGGASLNRGKKGESIRSIVRNYPHWFAPAYGGYAGREASLPVDQHMLIALIAPRPVFLGNAQRDVWSDPNGAFRAAKGADPIYEALGSDGLVQDELSSFHPEADLAFWMRPGTHGVVEEDWPAFLAFLDAHGFAKASGPPQDGSGQ